MTLDAAAQVPRKDRPRPFRWPFARRRV